MAVASASQSGRASRRTQGATPARNESPSGLGARSGSTAPQPTPATRRSARKASERLGQPKDVVTNAALPEIQTRQSYAYGSSKAPQLPEQLYAQGSMSMHQMTAQMDANIDRAQRNLGERAEAQNNMGAKEQSRLPQKEQVDSAKDKHDQTDPNQQIQQQLRVRHTTPVSQTTEVQKQRRTAAWASSLDDSHLEQITEESNLQDTPETRRTEPSSFPSGIFDHSYAYERGTRGPRAELRPSITSQFVSRAWNAIKQYFETVVIWSHQFSAGLNEWFRRFLNTAAKAFWEIPQSPFVMTLVKTLYIVCVLAFINMMFCLVYRNHLCDPTSSSQISRTLHNLCGTCQSSNPESWNLTAGNDHDIHQLTAALNNINSRLNSLESKLVNRIDAKHASVQVEMDTLRKQQNDLVGMLENLGHSSDADIASPLIPRVNFFAPANGAVVNPWYTSPTRSRLQSLPIRVALSVIGLKRYDVNGPVTALLPWQDVGDCWCASASAPGQDSVRLGVEVREMIYPTELVIEHPPFGTTLSPDTAPREIELWAAVDHFSAQQQVDLDTDSMRLDSKGIKDPISDRGGRIFVKLAGVEYDASSETNHVQRFRLDVNRFNDLRYHSSTFVVRVRTNHGAAHSCLYRIRLHGVPVTEDLRTAKFRRDWIENSA